MGYTHEGHMKLTGSPTREFRIDHTRRLVYKAIEDFNGTYAGEYDSFEVKSVNLAFHTCNVFFISTWYAM